MRFSSFGYVIAVITDVYSLGSYIFRSDAKF